MKNIAYHILDIVHNSIQAKATLVDISLVETTGNHSLVLSVEDNGTGMTDTEVKAACDPYFTSRKTRHIGMGLPLLKQNAEQTGGDFFISSQPGKGTVVRAGFNTKNIDCPAMGDIVGAIHSLVTTTRNVDFVYHHCKDNKEYVLDTRELKKVLEDTPIYQREISSYIKEMIAENLAEIGIIRSTVL